MKGMSYTELVITASSVSVRKTVSSILAHERRDNRGTDNRQKREGECVSWVVFFTW